MVICLERGAVLHMTQLMPLPLTVSCFGKIQIGLPFWYRLTWVVPKKMAVKRVCAALDCFVPLLNRVICFITLTIRYCSAFLMFWIAMVLKAAPRRCI